MLPKKKRIGRKIFPYILAKGKRYNSPHLLLYVAPDDLPDRDVNSRFSFSVSKKVSSSAVDRNKFRRQGYSVINKHIKNIRSGFYCFFSFKKSQTKVKFPVLEKEILELLSSSFVLI